MHSGSDVWPRRCHGGYAARLQDTGVFQRVLQYCLLDGGENESDIRRIGGLRETVMS